MPLDSLLEICCPKTEITHDRIIPNIRSPISSLFLSICMENTIMRGSGNQYRQEMMLPSVLLDMSYVFFQNVVGKIKV